MGKQDKLMIVTYVLNNLEFDPSADASAKQHPRIHLMERQAPRDADAPRRAWGRGCGKGRRSHAYIGEFDVEDATTGSLKIFRRLTSLAGDDGEEIGDLDAEEELKYLQLDVVFVFSRLARLTLSESKAIAEIAQPELAAVLAQKGATGKGAQLCKGRGEGGPHRAYESGLSLGDHSEKLAELKGMSVCIVLRGQRGC